MPRMKNETSVLLADLRGRIERIVAIARKEGHDQALDEIRGLVGLGARRPTATGALSRAPASGAGRRRPGRPRKAAAGEAAKKPDGRKNAWAGLTAEQRLARINAIRKGKGLPPRTE